MTVGNEALRRRDQRSLHDVIREDAARVAAVRDAVGPEVELFVDANCNLDLYHATQLAAMIKPLGIGFFEEPLTQNDVHQMAELRRTTGIPLACGQNEGLLFRFRDLLMNKSADILQPNVCISGGITQCLKVAGLAAAFNTMIENGGAWPFHNMHLHAGLANGGMVEYHYLAVELCRRCIATCPGRRPAGSPCRRRPASASSRTATRSARSRSSRCRAATPRGDGSAILASYSRSGRQNDGAKPRETLGGRP